MNRQERMKELVELLNKASKAYYQDAEEIMSNYEYDKLYDELQELERELGITLSNSPTVRAFFGQDERCRGIKEFCGRSEGTDVLENGRTYHCSDLPGRTSF